MTSPRPSRKRLALLSGLAALVLAVLATGWMHTPGARPVLRALGLPCPVKSASPEQVSSLRELGLANLRGPKPAPLRPALGMALDCT